MIGPIERVGIVLVHGIGEQKRFEHLEGHGRLLVDAMRRRPGAEVTVDILSSPGGSYRSEQNTWASSPSVRIAVKEGGAYREFFLHEVWWADVNEPYSIAKQLRFWLWGLSVWLYPRKDGSTSSGFKAMKDPEVPGLGRRRKFIVRLELFAVSSLFLMAAFPLGLVVVLAKRLLNLNPPDFLQTIVNYVSGVKLYNQRRRYGAALLFNKESDFLDTMEEPPRVSVRRRMIEVLADVALQRPSYDRWYVLSHSLGSVVAFNGLMEPGEMMANYLGKKRWAALKTRNMAGDRRDPLLQGVAYFDSRTSSTADALTPPVPARPVWLGPDDVVFRHLFLKNFRGLLTYGSPLEKFAAIWPARVPVNKSERHFPKGSEWINIYDPVDPVSGVLKAFRPGNEITEEHVPPARNIGFAAHWGLLYAHLRYLNLANDGPKDLGDAVANWLTTGSTFQAPAEPRKRWFVPYDSQHYRRWWRGARQWVAVYLLIGVMGAVFVPWASKVLPKWIMANAREFWSWIEQSGHSIIIDRLPSRLIDGWHWLWPEAQELIARTLGFMSACLILTFAVGVFASLFVFKRDPDDDRNKGGGDVAAKPAFVAEMGPFGYIYAAEDQAKVADPKAGTKGA
ncbi:MULTISPECIES: hypothetical protein [unclassified Bradyrhizobium]|uniref:hypothetical protein n=1 Tax=unclassified Bradyrhizobium TaxID=2631580 RepID=UPI002305DD4A|nr:MULTISPECIES: hypothetical protein [unclassified Bradyrhizobium]MDA9451162.1 hypothetical protein [Bradyrhizobium sp. CCBAU 21360]MDA9457541.1 hypothetical protein [Bradyrhizobium sp. CCBAU 21359]